MRIIAWFQAARAPLRNPLFTRFFLVSFRLKEFPGNLQFSRSLRPTEPRFAKMGNQGFF